MRLENKSCWKCKNWHFPSTISRHGLLEGSTFLFHYSYTCWTPFESSWSGQLKYAFSPSKDLRSKNNSSLKGKIHRETVIARRALSLRYEQLWTSVKSCEKVCERLWTGVKRCEQLWTGGNRWEQVWTSVNRWEKMWTIVNRCEKFWTGLNKWEQVWSTVFLRPWAAPCLNFAYPSTKLLHHYTLQKPLNVRGIPQILLC